MEQLASIYGEYKDLILIFSAVALAVISIIIGIKKSRGFGAWFFVATIYLLALSQGYYLTGLLSLISFVVLAISGICILVDKVNR